ncbi:MAG: hypothetical protein LBD29_09830, partial [Treponema sp.]|nr:hypothetical protein [Treponema sp.]
MVSWILVSLIIKQGAFMVWGIKKNVMLWGGIALNIFLFGACSSLQAGLYLVSIDDNNGKTILENESAVKTLLENMAASPEQYDMKAFARTGIGFQMKRTKLLTHSYYLFISNNGEYHTLSFYGTKMSFYSEGAWALDSDSDIGSYRTYMQGNNKWDVTELFPEERIDVRKTIENILNKINSGITYYYKD